MTIASILVLAFSIIATVSAILGLVFVPWREKRTSMKIVNVFTLAIAVTSLSVSTMNATYVIYVHPYAT